MMYKGIYVSHPCVRLLPAPVRAGQQPVDRRKTEIKDEAARLVAYLSLALKRKPQAIHECHPEQFVTVAEVYTVKRILLDRLRRKPTIRQFVS
jgi:hypothetical protein